MTQSLVCSFIFSCSLSSSSYQNLHKKASGQVRVVITDTLQSKSNVYDIYGTNEQEDHTPLDTLNTPVGALLKIPFPRAMSIQCCVPTQKGFRCEMEKETRPLKQHCDHLSH